MEPVIWRECAPFRGLPLYGFIAHRAPSLNMRVHLLDELPFDDMLDFWCWLNMNWCQWSNENFLLVRTKWGHCTDVWPMSFPSFISLMPRITLLLNQIQWLAFSTVSCLFLITFAESSSRLLKAISATNHQWIHNNQLWLRDYMHSSLPLRIHSTVTHNSHISLPAQNQCCLHVGPSTQWGRRYSSQNSANHYISGIGKKRSQPERSAETSTFPPIRCCSWYVGLSCTDLAILQWWYESPVCWYLRSFFGVD